MNLKPEEDVVTKIENTTLVMGLGKSGMSVVRYLRARGEKFLAMDTREDPPGKDEVVNLLPREWLRFGSTDNLVIGSAQRIIISPGLSVNETEIQQAIKQGAEVIGDIELFAQAAKAPVIAITGSNGKSTVTSLLGEIAQGAGRSVRVGGNIGVPALDLLDGNEPDYYILELSSFQLETTHTLNAYASTVLNISPDHMDRYDRLGDYVDAKLRVYRGDGFKVINRDETGDWLQLVRNSTPRDKIISFGLDSPAAGEFGLRQIKDKQWLSYGDENIVTAEQLKISGTHNISNALAALALGKAMGFSIEAMLPGLIAYAGLPHRTQWVACENGVNWYNDSKGTNVGATIAAIQGFSGEKILIAGGVGKGADFHQLDATIRNHKVMHVVLYGHDAKLIENDLGSDISISHANSLIQAVEIAKILSKPGWLVLFSPACASFDMFENYEKRGEAFVAAVKQVTKCH